MNLNPHWELRGKHALLSPSQPSWLNYTEEKMQSVYSGIQAVELGTRKHALAAEHIALNEKMPKSKRSLCAYVNDAIGLKMIPEQPLFYSENCFGTADAISFEGNMLRIHDLKTGTHPGKMEQLKIYAALFCLEYGIRPIDISIELRIYQFDEVTVETPDFEEIENIMAKIILLDNVIENAKSTSKGNRAWTKLKR